MFLVFIQQREANLKYPAMGVEVLKRIGDDEPKYLSPGEIFDLPQLSADTVKSICFRSSPVVKKTCLIKSLQSLKPYDPRLAFANISVNRFLSALDNYSTW